MELVQWLESLEITDVNIVTACLSLFFFSFALEFILTFAYIIKSGVNSVG